MRCLDLSVMSQHAHGFELDKNWILDNTAAAVLLWEREIPQ